MKEILLKQVAFEHWANSQLLVAMKKCKPLDDKALLLLSHLLSSGNMWVSRINDTPITTTLFQERTIAECEILLSENTEKLNGYIKKADSNELKRIIEFTFPIDGTTRKMSAQDAILHIVHHSSYHRGQIVSKLKESIDQLPLITYVIFATEN